MATKKTPKISNYRDSQKKIENNRKNFIYKNFRISIKYIKETRNYIFFSFFLFFFFILTGYIFPIFFQDQILNYIKELVKETEKMNIFELIAFIINNNILNGFIGMIFGVLIGIIPLGVIIVNGYVIGFVINKTVAFSGAFVLWRLVPHGIFEIPAIMISVGLGLKLGAFLFRGKDKKRGFLALFVFIISIFFSLLLLSVIIILIALAFGKNPSALQGLFPNLMKNPLWSLLFFLIFLDFIIGSIFVSLQVFEKKDKNFIIKNLKSDFKNSIRAFIFVVIPLLVIAGIIEGVLIAVMG